MWRRPSNTAVTVPAFIFLSDDKRKQAAEQQAARTDLMARLTGEAGKDVYGFSIEAPGSIADDPAGDDLDAFIFAVQAAWALSQADRGFGAPRSLDRLEGWISDPALARLSGDSRYTMNMVTKM
jgi:hypothetical protein